MEKHLLGVQELAAYLGIKPATVYSWVFSGRIPHYKVGRLTKFSPQDIEDWLKEHRVERNPKWGEIDGDIQERQ